MADLERPKIKVGFIPIIDCAPIVLAEELGAYERQGLEVEIRREVSWANVRDKLALGELDASHILAPLPLALTLGIDSVNVPVINAMTLQANGNALTLSKGLWQEMEEAAPELVGNGRRRSMPARWPPSSPSGRPRAPSPSCWPRCFPYSVQNYMLRLWLSSAGLDPDRDVRLTVVPPPHTVAYLSGGVIDGYCVGEPWNQQSEALGIGRIALTGPDIWKGMPEKVLGTTESWAANNPNTLKALIKALIEACLWLDEPANRPRPRASCRARAISTCRPRSWRARSSCRASTSSSATPPTSRGAATPTGSWRRWCAGSRHPPTPTSRPSPTASIAPTSTAPRRARWASTALMSIACRRAVMANLFCRHATTSLRPQRLPASCADPINANSRLFFFRRRVMKTRKFGRRDILKGATATAALMASVRASFPSGAFAQAGGPETNKVTLGFIALTDSSPLIIAKEKKLFDKYGITDANVAKQASWGTTRDNIVLGSGSGGIDGAHILTPKPYQITMGTTTPENKPVPMYILCRLNYDCQAISVAKEFKGLGITVDAKAFKEALRQEEGQRQGNEGRHDLPAAAPTTCGSATGWPPAASTPTRTSPPSSCRRRRWWPT